MIKLVSGLFHNEEQSKQELADFIVSTNQLSIGEECLKFEEAFAEYQGRSHCVLFNSGSSANLALVQALLNLQKISRGDRAAFSAITWATNVMPLVQLGLIPVPVDVEMDTLNSSSRMLQAILEQVPDVRLFFLTNLLGFCDDIDSIKQLCDARGIVLIEDNCESLGSVYNGVRLGNWGLASTFSFYVGHHMSTIEGGAVCTDDPELAMMLKMVRAHGWDRNLNEREKHEIRTRNGIDDSLFLANFTFYVSGYNLRPTEITGFLGNQQLQYLSLQLAVRKSNFARLSEAMRDNPDLLPLKSDHLDSVPSFAMPVICRDSDLVPDYLAAYAAHDIETRPLLGGSIPDQPFYKELNLGEFVCENARLLSRQGFYSPNHEGLSESDLVLLCDILRQPFKEPISS